MNKEHDLKIVDDALKVLSEHFDSVRIFCTRHEDNETGTVNFTRGVGNWFAGYGHIKKWVEMEEEEWRSKAREGQ